MCGGWNEWCVGKWLFKQLSNEWWLPRGSTLLLLLTSCMGSFSGMLGPITMPLSSLSFLSSRPAATTAACCSATRAASSSYSINMRHRGETSLVTSSLFESVGQWSDSCVASLRGSDWKSWLEGKEWSPIMFLALQMYWADPVTDWRMQKWSYVSSVGGTLSPTMHGAMDLVEAICFQLKLLPMCECKALSSQSD